MNLFTFFSSFLWVTLPADFVRSESDFFNGEAVVLNYFKQKYSCVITKFRSDFVDKLQDNVNDRFLMILCACNPMCELLFVRESLSHKEAAR